MEGPASFVQRVMSVFFDVEGMMGKNFQDGLADLRKVAEQESRMSNLPSDLPPDFGSAFGRLLGLKKLGVEDMKLMILLETAGEPLYFGLADGVSSEEARSLLRQNGREETAHAHRLKKAIEILTGEPYAIPTLEENPYGKPPAMGPVTPELLRGLIQAEFGGDKLYQTYAANEPDPRIAELLLQNGREETRHGQRVEQVIALLGG